jgi:hypothetical protein
MDATKRFFRASHPGNPLRTLSCSRSPSANDRLTSEPPKHATAYPGESQPDYSPPRRSCDGAGDGNHKAHRARTGE